MVLLDVDGPQPPHPPSWRGGSCPSTAPKALSQALHTKEQATSENNRNQRRKHPGGEALTRSSFDRTRRQSPTAVTRRRPAMCRPPAHPCGHQVPSRDSPHRAAAAGPEAPSRPWAQCTAGASGDYRSGAVGPPTDPTAAAPCRTSPVPSATMTRAKRHHYVPAAYLAGFGEGGSVLVRRRHRPAMYVTSVKNVAVEGGFYEVLGDDGQPSDAIERGLASLEGEALVALREVEQSQQVPPVGSSARSTLATFLAVQFTRTPLHRERIMFP